MPHVGQFPRAPPAPWLALSPRFGAPKPTMESAAGEDHEFALPDGIGAAHWEAFQDKVPTDEADLSSLSHPLAPRELSCGQPPRQDPRL